MPNIAGRISNTSRRPDPGRSGGHDGGPASGRQRDGARPCRWARSFLGGAAAYAALLARRADAAQHPPLEFDHQPFPPSPEQPLRRRMGSPDMSKQLQKGIGTLPRDYNKSYQAVNKQRRWTKGAGALARHLLRDRRRGRAGTPEPARNPAATRPPAFAAKSQLKPYLETKIKPAANHGDRRGFPLPTARWRHRMRWRSAASNDSSATGLYQFMPNDLEALRE